MKREADVRNVTSGRAHHRLRCRSGGRIEILIGLHMRQTSISVRVGKWACETSSATVDHVGMAGVDSSQSKELEG